MQRPTLATSHENMDSRPMERYLENGNRLHDRAVADFFARMASAGMLFVRNAFAWIGQTHAKSEGGAGLSVVKRSIRTPV